MLILVKKLKNLSDGKPITAGFESFGKKTIARAKCENREKASIMMLLKRLRFIVML